MIYGMNGWCKPVGDKMRWYEIRADNLRPVTVIIGGRGIGKTYGTITFLLSQGEKFIYLRNTDVQLKESASEFGNPFKRWNIDHNRMIEIKPEGKHYVIQEDGEALGYAAALSTFKNLRGVDLSDVRYVLFDEFIEREKIRFDQFSAFSNFYETINRNREILGEDPLKCILLSNAQKLDNGILAGYGFIPRIEKMIKQDRHLEKTKEYCIELPVSEVSSAKADTALYKLTAGSRYAREALGNEFANDSFQGIGSRPIAEFKPVVRIDGLWIYRHKSDGTYYISRIPADTPELESRDNFSLFMRNYGIRLRDLYALGKLTYCDFSAKATICNLLKV